MRIENWTLCEQQEIDKLPLLRGNIYGDPRYPDGSLIYTEQILKRRGFVAIDIDGREIMLGRKIIDGDITKSYEVLNVPDTKRT